MAPKTAHWTDGFTQTELDDAQERYGLVFPEDLVALLRERRPVDGYDWSTENENIRRMLEWPFDMLALDVEHGFWWPAWGERPAAKRDREDALRAALERAPRLIPLIAHRFLPEMPREPGNPVLSMHGFDAVYYGANLADYFENEFSGRGVVIEGPIRRVPFWSDLVEGFDTAYAYYEAYQAELAKRPRN